MRVFAERNKNDLPVSVDLRIVRVIKFFIDKDILFALDKHVAMPTWQVNIAD